SFFIGLLMPFSAFAAIDDCMTRTTVPEDVMNLPQIIEMGLCRNPQTTASYLSYQSARFSKNASYAKYLPSVNASGSASLPYRNENWGDWSYGASLSASYLIFDFGKRLSDVSQTIATWHAAGFEYDETVQNYIYSLIGSYYALLNADADVKSAEMLRTVAQTARDTAQKKYKAGSVARADVLKADTTLASRDLDLERAKNNREIAKGSLLNKLSFPADQDIKIADMPSEFGTPQETKSLEELFEQAQKTRPDLLRASANKDAAWHRRNSTFLSNLPSISASGSLSWNDTPSESFNAGNDNISGSIGIRASMPLFAGFANMYNLRSAQANYDRAVEQERATQDNASLDIFTAYQNYKTAQTLLKQTETLLKSATESEKVTAGMYKVGRATMLDWQTAQSELVSAEKQNNAAKYDLFTKRAAVALAVGEIKTELSKEEENVEKE
ncbi:MAG: TolC family protein, partial [Alphaproteobacteria bacterium]|nr:TolC family protein [Alphaproteobacteria bacterium]